jgi:hypothetical protein
MKNSTIIKVNFLVIALGLTIYTIYALQTRGLSPEVRALFGLSPNIAATEGGAAGDTSAYTKLNWCDTRVVSLIRPNEFKLTQVDSNWVYETTAQKVVDFIAVEKWFARFCKVPAQNIGKETNLTKEAFSPFLMVKFVNGTIEVMRRNLHGVFDWRGQKFTSPEFEGAVDELKQLPDGRRR